MIERIPTEDDLMDATAEAFAVRTIAEALTMPEQVAAVRVNHATDAAITKTFAGRETEIFWRLLQQAQLEGDAPQYRPSLTAAYVRRVIAPIHLRLAPRFLDLGEPSACVAVADFGLGMYGALRDFTGDEPLTRRQFESLHNSSTQLTKSALGRESTFADDMFSAKAADGYEQLIQLLNTETTGFQAADYALTLLREDELHTPLFSLHFVNGAVDAISHYKRLFPFTSGIVPDRPQKA